MEDHTRTRELLGALVSGADVTDDLRRLLEAHFAFEESLLIPLLVKHLPADTGPIPVLLEEHRTILGLLEDLPPDAPDGVRRRLEILLRSHIDKEEELIIPFARTQFGPDDLARIGCRPEEGRPPECER